jgi:hypothetical protein
MDVRGHLCWNNVETLKACYQMIDEKLGEIRRRGNKSVILIVSDHGMQGGLHTHKGIYSVNKHLNLNTPKITDFYAILQKILVETNEKTARTHSKEKVLEQLRDLGYF